MTVVYVCCRLSSVELQTQEQREQELRELRNENIDLLNRVTVLEADRRRQQQQQRELAMSRKRSSSNSSVRRRQMQAELDRLEGQVAAVMEAKQGEAMQQPRSAAEVCGSCSRAHAFTGFL